MPLWQWHEIPNTALSSVQPSPVPYGGSGPQSKIDAWCGAALKRQGSVYMLGAAGGHGDYAGNEVDAITLNSENPAWRQLKGPTAAADLIDSAFYLDRRPGATHTYWAQQFINSRNLLLSVCNPGMGMSGLPDEPAGWPYAGTRKRTPAFNYATQEWENPDYIGFFPSETGDPIACLCVKHPWTDDIYYSRNYSDGWYRWTSATNTWSKLSNGTRGPWYAGSAIDPVRNRMLIVGGYSPMAPEVRNLDGSAVAASFTGSGASALARTGYPGVVFDESLDRFLVLFNDAGVIKVLVVHPTTWAVSDPGATGNAPAARKNGIHNSVQYVPELRGFVIANGYQTNMRFMRTAA